MKLRGLTAAALLLQSSFPRISPDEEFLLRDFLREHGRLYDYFSIDVPVGRGASCVSSASGVVDQMWAAITRHRIDALAFHEGAVDVVEAKVHATMKAATQVRRYCDEYAREHPFVDRVRPVIVCRSSSPGLAGLMQNVGGRLLEIPAIVAFRGDASPGSSKELPHD